MKAILMAAGFGSRLKPLTDSTPKCLIDINNKPLLQYWIDLFEKYNINEVLINTHYLHEQVENYIASYSGPIKFKLVYEPELLGSGGTLYSNKSFVETEQDFLICYADNLTNINLNDIINYHKESKHILTMATFSCENPCACGIAHVNDNNIITEFIEKPKENIYGNLANAGIYVANNNIFNYITKEDFDIGKNIIPKLVNKMRAYKLNCYLLDIGTINNLNRARREVNDYF